MNEMRCKEGSLRGATVGLCRLAKPPRLWGGWGVVLTGTWSVRFCHCIGNGCGVRWCAGVGGAIGFCRVTVWAGCLCFWVLGPGLKAPTAERAARGRAVGFLGLWVSVSEGGWAVCLEGMDNPWLLLPSHPLVTIAAGMLRKSSRMQLILRMWSGQRAGSRGSPELED